jgi:lysozyme
MMKISEKGLRLLAQWEGEILHVYKDQAGLPTIGIGHLLTRKETMSGAVVIGGFPVPIANGITHQQALDLLTQDLDPAEAEVNAHVKVTLTQDQFDALVIFTFNVGIGGFESSSALKAINAGNFAEVPADLMKWNKITDPKTHQHVVCNGLVERRNKEIKLWNGEYA